MGAPWRWLVFKIEAPDNEKEEKELVEKVTEAAGELGLAWDVDIECEDEPDETGGSDRPPTDEEKPWHQK